MKTEDLMIGDWVHLINTIHNVSFPENGVIQDEGYTTNHTPIKITTISENCVSYYSKKFESYITLSNEDIEPIPLTPGMLEKNGFEVSSEHARYYFEEDEEKYEFVLRKMYYINDTEKQKGWAFYAFNVVTIIDYVHELQHALRMCGIKKTFVL